MRSSDNLKSVFAAAARQTPPLSPTEIRAVVPGQVDAAGFGEILAQLYDSGVGIPSHTVMTALEVLHRARPKVRTLVVVDAHSQEISTWGYLERELGGIAAESVLDRLEDCLRQSNSFESEVWVVGELSVTFELIAQFKTLAVPVYQVTPAALCAVALGEELGSEQSLKPAEPTPKPAEPTPENLATEKTLIAENRGLFAVIIALCVWMFFMVGLKSTDHDVDLDYSSIEAQEQEVSAPSYTLETYPEFTEEELPIERVFEIFLPELRAPSSVEWEACERNDATLAAYVKFYCEGRIPSSNSPIGKEEVVRFHFEFDPYIIEPEEEQLESYPPAKCDTHGHADFAYRNTGDFAIKGTLPCTANQQRYPQDRWWSDKKSSHESGVFRVYVPFRAVLNNDGEAEFLKLYTSGFLSLDSMNMVMKDMGLQFDPASPDSSEPSK